MTTKIEAKVIADSVSDEEDERRPIAGYEREYEVDRAGRVWSIPRWVKGGVQRVPGGELKLSVHGTGYLVVHLARGGVSKTHRVHRLVAAAFLPPDPDRPHVNHINNDKHDNRVENLEWVTPQENTDHAKLLGRVDFAGVKNPAAKLTRSDLEAAIEAIEGGCLLQEIAKKLSVSHNTVPKALDREFGRGWRAAQKPQYRGADWGVRTDKPNLRKAKAGVEPNGPEFYTGEWK